MAPTLDGCRPGLRLLCCCAAFRAAADRAYAPPSSGPGPTVDLFVKTPRSPSQFLVTPKKAWAEVFRNEALPLIDEERFAPMTAWTTAVPTGRCDDEAPRDALNNRLQAGALNCLMAPPAASSPRFALLRHRLRAPRLQLPTLAGPQAILDSPRSIASSSIRPAMATDGGRSAGLSTLPALGPTQFTATISPATTGWIRRRDLRPPFPAPRRQEGFRDRSLRHPRLCTPLNAGQQRSRCVRQLPHP